VNILGAWDGHDAGAALLADGQLVAAVNEERLTRRKLDIVFPQRSIQSCLDLAGLDRSAIDIVASSTSDVAKAVGRILPSTKQTYYDVRRRKAAPGRLASYTRRSKYLITDWRAAHRACGRRRIDIKVNRRLRRLDGVDDVFVFPHMGDGGLALGAALRERGLSFQACGDLPGDVAGRLGPFLVVPPADQ
jgi:predicted NodU family carbamoyl transferase